MIADIVIEVAAVALRGIARVIGDVFISFLFEVAVQGTGYVISKPFKPDTNPDGRLSTVVGLTFWVAIIAMGYFVWNHYR